ncbi:helix-turn-helix transcriptional regulator [uncultured Microbulbifer sp.]|uniref:helix-turn-helix transcriptional regulator n=1 Tax=uncultured Microbulbifer sp. TaxID=348147 RepID=UPI0026391E54|nr:helix-turn-helix transcriptional regulator [uncultured Microbulbifer sp.]
MEVKVNTKKIISLRTTRAWSQQQLAEVASVSLRTIQRIEKSGNASHVKSISSAFSVKPDDILVQEKQKFSVTKRVKKYLSAMLAFGSASLLYASLSVASPIMLKVDASSNNEQLASIHLLNEEGGESEMRIDNMLKFEVSAQQTPKNQIRLKTKVYEFKGAIGFVHVSSPILLTEFNKSAGIKFTTSNGIPLEIQVTPEN